MTLLLQIENQSQKAQKLRIKRCVVASTNYILLLGALLLLEAAEVIKITDNEFYVLVLTSLGIVGALLTIFFTELNLKFKDPSLTNIQLISCIIWGEILIVLYPEIRPQLLILFFPAYSFGFLRLTKAQYLFFFGLVFTLYIATLVVEYFWLRPQLNIPHELVLMICFMTSIGWFTYFGGLINRIREKLHIQSNTDFLTQQYNRKYAIDLLQYLHNLCKRYQGYYSVALIDIDHFKQVNDKYGHPFGDKVLQHFSNTINKTLRESDFVLSKPDNHSHLSKIPDSVLARYGGEEFIIILPHTTAKLAKSLCERIRDALNTHTHIGQIEISITFSAGIATFTQLDSLEMLLSKADKALYHAKQNGRDKVCLVEELY